ncbi:hypothetical protein NBT05_16205 [Aquimarina sp. ERC-38]|uniref:hypothetical protein n=1 Tax=Aquimarina sp. ERC-38 TaxID=2949996 RepID=UPI00224778E0|nr:hypothetical protein [Aquimarina sp. ERC-38]UZO80481.1 hypothetical protein NBT05_16205 [Aquimarina sp. ERC-38]
MFWVILGILFLFLGLDELLRIHEKIGQATSKVLDTSGIFYYAWIIPYVSVLLILSFLLLRPFLQLPASTRNGFMMAGGLFVLGAVGLEMISGWYEDTYNIADYNLYRTLPIFFMYTVEELLEMIGVTYFIYVLIKFIERYSTR